MILLVAFREALAACIRKHLFTLVQPIKAMGNLKPFSAPYKPLLTQSEN